MKCQNCGKELPTGHLYCEHCGAEFQIVPDFEPEIENSIAETMSAVSETVEAEAKHSLKELQAEIGRRLSKGQLFGIGAVLIAAVCFGMFLYLKSADAFGMAVAVTPKEGTEEPFAPEIAAESEGAELLPEEAEPVMEPEKVIPKPEVFPASGNYKDAQFIELAVPEGYIVYYTNDLSMPSPETGILYEQPIPIPLGESRYTFIAFDEKGNRGESVHRNYMLNMKTGITLEDAETLLVQKLISTGHLLDKNGALPDRYGVFRYFYKYPMAFGEKNYYIFEEHYMENLINDPQGNFYAIEVMEGEVYRLEKDGNGEFVRADF